MAYWIRLLEMTADKILPEAAFEAGAELWVITSEQNKWWQQIDFRTGFLLSQCLLFQKTEASTNIDTILKETQISNSTFFTAKKSILVGTESHFFNKWLLITPKDEKLALKEIVEVCDSLKVHSLRFFNSSQQLIAAVTARPSASLNRISFVE